MDSTTFDAGLEHSLRPPFDVPTHSDPVRRIWQGSGKWEQETLDRETVAGYYELYSVYRIM